MTISAPHPWRRQGSESDMCVQSLQNLNQRLDWRTGTDEYRWRPGTENEDWLCTDQWNRLQPHPAPQHRAIYESLVRKSIGCLWACQRMGYLPTELPQFFFLTLKIYSKELLNIWRKPLSWQRQKQRGKSNRGNKAHIWQTENNFKKLIHISREMRRYSICQTSLW